MGNDFIPLDDDDLVDFSNFAGTRFPRNSLRNGEWKKKTLPPPTPPKKLSFYEKLKLKFMSIPFIAKYNAKKAAKNEKDEYQKMLKSLGIDEKQLYCAGVIKDCHT